MDTAAICVQDVITGDRSVAMSLSLILKEYFSDP